MKIKNNIKSRMAYVGMTRSDLAKAIGSSEATISYYCSGNLGSIKLKALAKLCKALNCTPNDLFELVDVKGTAA